VLLRYIQIGSLFLKEQSGSQGVEVVVRKYSIANREGMWGVKCWQILAELYDQHAEQI
jgi:hypothetical protein